MDLGISNSYLEIDFSIVSANVKKIREGIDQHVRLMPVLKGNAYGAGMIPYARHLTRECGIDVIACAETFEALQLYDAGIRCELLVLAGVPYHNIPCVVSKGFMSPAYHIDYLERLNREAESQNRIARVHIKLDTGLNRIGVLPGQELEVLCRALSQLKSISTVGVFTHFVESDAVDKDFTYLQMNRFKAGVAQILGHGIKLEYVHAFNTSAVSWLRDPAVTHIRAGGLFLGYDTCLEPVNGIGVEECMSWRAFVTNIRKIQTGETAGYGHMFRAARPTTIAVVSIGYGDGYSRYLAAFQGAEIIVNGHRAKIVAVCMDQMLLDVTGIDVQMNDTVTLLGRDGGEYISAMELQKKMGQIYLAVLAGITSRVQRVYIP